MKEDTYYKLEALKFRLYCVWQAAQNGEDAMYEHKESIGSELNNIWSELGDILKSEKDHITVGNECKLKKVK
jgi:hypothetical protein